jgi:hypothetical protein
MNKLYRTPKSSGNWTYQFDSAFTLPEEQAALALRDDGHQSNDFIRLTDAEAELSEREAKRALRRAARQKDSSVSRHDGILPP